MKPRNSAASARAAWLLGSIALTAELAAAQEILAESKSYFGRSVAAIPDLDGDGRLDFAVGLGLANGQDGEVRVYSSSTHELLFTLTGPGHRRHFGMSRLEMIEDLDGDGIGELSVGLSSPTTTEIVSLRKRSILFELDGVYGALISIPDLDRDGHRDLLACDVPALRAFSGASGKPIESRLLDSLNGLVPAPISNKPAGTTGIIVTEAGSVRFFDGRVSLESGGPIQFAREQGKSDSKWPEASRKAAFAGADFDKDGVLDLIEIRKVGHWKSPVASETCTLEFEVWHSKDRSADFARSWEIDVEAPESIEEALSLPGDVDGDGVEDIAVADSSYFHHGGVRMLSGKDGRELWRFAPLEKPLSNGFIVQVATGTTIRVMGDLDGDGACDLVVGCGSYTETSGIPPDGSVLLLSGRTGKVLHRIDESSIR